MTAAKPAPASETLRQIIGDVANEQATVDRVRQIVHDALDTEQARKVDCPECGTSFRVKMPDTKKQLEAAIQVLEQVEGRAPTTTVDSGLVVEIRRNPL